MEEENVEEMAEEQAIWVHGRLTQPRWNHFVNLANAWALIAIAINDDGEVINEELDQWIPGIGHPIFGAGGNNGGNNGGNDGGGDDGGGNDGGGGGVIGGVNGNGGNHGNAHIEEPVEMDDDGGFGDNEDDNEEDNEEGEAIAEQEGIAAAQEQALLVAEEEANPRKRKRTDNAWIQNKRIRLS